MSRSAGVIQKINILIMNQSAIDLLGSAFSLLHVLIPVEGTGMSRDSARDLFVCRYWMSRLPLWTFLIASTYGIILTAFERYFAVIYPIWYKVKLCTLISFCVISLDT